MSSSALLGWLERCLHSNQNGRLQEWVIRAVVTLLLAVVWHWYNRGNDPPPSLSYKGVLADKQLLATPDNSDTLATPRRSDNSNTISLPSRKDAETQTLSYEELVSVSRNEDDGNGIEDVNDIDDASEEEQMVQLHEEREEKLIEEEAKEETAVPLSIDEVKSEKEGEVRSKEKKSPKKAGGKRSTPSSTKRTAPRRSSPSAVSEISTRRPIKATSDRHPGLQQFYHWYNVETSLYRIYELGRTDGVPVIPPFLPKSERGNTNVHVKITNNLTVPIHVFWVDYKGKEVDKGRVGPGGEWNQMTWIGHPWTVRKADSEELLLHYIPYRVIPNSAQVSTLSPDDDTVGMHTFGILPHIPGTPYTCRVVDPVLPHPPQYTLDTPILAGRWTLQHMERTDYYNLHMLSTNRPLLIKYLTNIVHHPEEAKYRQVRVAQPQFYSHVWNTAARGLLLACGFVEEEAFAELGSPTPLSSDRVSDVSYLLLNFEQWQRQQQTRVEAGTVVRQPQGADGFGRAGFGRAGAMGI